MEVQAPTEQNLLGEEAVRLGRDWPTEHDDTTHIKRGYYRRDNGLLGKVIDGVKLTESDDDYSSFNSTKRARMCFWTSESDLSDIGSPKVEATADDENTSECAAEAETDDDKEKVDDKKYDNVEDDGINNEDAEEENPWACNLKDVCRQTIVIDSDGNEEECGGETDGCSQMCHSCKQAMKRLWFM